MSLSLFRSACAGLSRADKTKFLPGKITQPGCSRNLCCEVPVLHSKSYISHLATWQSWLIMWMMRTCLPSSDPACRLWIRSSLVGLERVSWLWMLFGITSFLVSLKQYLYSIKLFYCWQTDCISWKRWFRFKCLLIPQYLVSVNSSLTNLKLLHFIISVVKNWNSAFWNAWLRKEICYRKESLAKHFPKEAFFMS